MDGDGAGFQDDTFQDGFGGDGDDAMYLEDEPAPLAVDEHESSAAAVNDVNGIEAEHIPGDGDGVVNATEAEKAIAELKEAQLKLARMLEVASQVMDQSSGIESDQLNACQPLVIEFGTLLHEVRETVRARIASCPRPLRFSRNSDNELHRFLFNLRRLELAQQLSQQLQMSPSSSSSSGSPAISIPASEIGNESAAP